MAETAEAVGRAARTGLVCRHCSKPVRRDGGNELTTVQAPAAKVVHVATESELCADGERLAAPIDALTAAAS